MRYDVS